MNFFEHQERARGTTRWLVLLFIGAVISLILGATLIVSLVLATANAQQGAAPVLDPTALPLDVLAGVSAVVLVVVALGAAFRFMQLRAGGKAVAQGLGGRLLNVNTRNADERKVLNVVEEMAIAAGVPVPQVYLLEEAGINAFAAGHTPQDAVIGVTRGCIALLSRDELQGVIAHEFSHIFNGDMRLNLRLIGWLYGITVLGLIGYFLLRGQSVAAARSRNNNRGALVLVGLGLMAVGYGGTLFGNLIKAAVSRQREFLADASAVQYTRNPAGIGGALKKIGANAKGSLLDSAGTGEVGHLLFGQGVRSNLMTLFATHPPLEERIRRIDPQWSGEFAPAASPNMADAVTEDATTPAAGATDRAGAAGMTDAADRTDATGMTGTLGTPGASAAFAPVAGLGLLARVGEPDATHMASAQAQLRALPAALREASRNTLGAMLLMFALLLSNTDQAAQRRRQGWLHTRLNAASYRQLQALLDDLVGLPRPFHLPLVELALPALRELSEAQCRDFLADLRQLIEIDAHVSLFEWCLFTLLHQGLQDRAPTKATLALPALRTEAAVVLSALASAGSATEAEAVQAFDAGITALGLAEPLPFAWQAFPDLRALDHAFARLNRLAPRHKQSLLQAMVNCVQHDGLLTPEEHELVRAAASLLDCPMPPLYLEQPPGLEQGNSK